MGGKMKYILVGLGLVVVAVLCWFFLLNPLRGEAAEVQQDIDDERQKVSMMKTTLAQAEATRDEGRRNQARLLELTKMVPPSEELPSLLLQLQDLADQSGIKFISVTPGRPRSPASGTAYQIVPLELVFGGTYFDVTDFAYRAEQMVAGPGRLLALSRVDLSVGAQDGAGSDVSPQLSVTMSVSAYILAAPEAPPASPSSADTTESN